MAVGTAMTTNNWRHEHGLLLLAFNQISNNASGCCAIPPAATKIHFVNSWSWWCRATIGCRTFTAARNYFQAVPGRCLFDYLQRQRSVSQLLSVMIILLLWTCSALQRDLPEEEYVLPLDKAESSATKELRQITHLLMRMHHHTSSGRNTGRMVWSRSDWLISLKPLVCYRGASMENASVITWRYETGGIGAELTASITIAYLMNGCTRSAAVFPKIFHSRTWPLARAIGQSATEPWKQCKKWVALGLVVRTKNQRLISLSRTKWLLWWR